MAAKFDDLSVKTALYRYERGRVFRPSKVELEADQFSCPRCHAALISVRIRLQETALSCPNCQWSIHRDDLWQPQQEQEPAVRQPGEATEDDPTLDTATKEEIESLELADTLSVPVTIL
jgi:predicted RNA-binding Zn-ribbon protein involved in translation (DUF1610 family)